ncbi:anhydro-N-acetylmuramic acid kinase [Clostridium butyricum]|uniref:anhydro-N-acetylmuramic acid kinase AnmK n=1 Tax=Clostridium butyricum TaxID=1492 RepID=UPI000F523B21|nr:anhydro-N-acetylmuramic acid kinase AnmK [Clostridium butyricum]RQN10274.1 anhydro-N-acetylmuramic acid kinase [Clostridium butyricum]
MNGKYGIGIMSGTSLDGIDVVLIKIDGYGLDTKLHVVAFDTIPFNVELRNKIKKCISIKDSDSQLICSLNFELGHAFSNGVKVLCKKINFDVENIDFIGSHGQTIFHIPNDVGEFKRSTLQIGEPAIIAYEIGCTVVSNFRTMDIAAGGQGAPLVPLSEYILYKSNKNRVLQNIGGIGNVTVIPKNSRLDDVFAFDTGPGNMIIDETVFRLTGEKYDKNGEIAARGKIIYRLLDDLMKNKYIYQSPPKTTGRELFGAQFVHKILKKCDNEKIEDIIATVTMFTAKSIEYNYKNYIEPKYTIEEVIIGGGGSYNNTLLSMMKDIMPNYKILTQEELGFSSENKEAIAFAILANETLEGSFGNITAATGAYERVILGNITPAPKKFI